MAAVTQQDPSYTSTRPTEPNETLEQQLERLRGERTAAKEAQTAASVKVTDLQGRIAALTTLQNDIDKATANYVAAHPALVEGEQSRRVYYDYETKCLTEIVGAARATIEQVVTDAETELDDATAAVEDAKATLADLELQLAEADEARQLASTAANELKNLAATVKARLAKLDTIKTKVNAAQKDAHYALAYWLLVMGEFSSILEREPKLMDPAELPDALLDAVNALSDAEAACAAKALEVSQQQAVLVDAEAELKTLTKEYDEKLRNALIAINPAEQSGPSKPSESANNTTHEETDDA
jgi:hypothetical protein